MSFVSIYTYVNVQDLLRLTTIHKWWYNLYTLHNILSPSFAELEKTTIQPHTQTYIQ